MNNIQKTISIRSKFFFIIFLNVVFIISLLYFTSTLIISKSYNDIEKDSVIQNIQRANDAIVNSISELTGKLNDWAFWDDTYQFVQDKNQHYINSNLRDASILNLKINAMIFTDTKGEIIFKKSIDLNLVQEISSENIGSYVLSYKELTTHEDANSAIDGIIILPEGPLIISSQAILTSELEGPIQGSLIFGKFLDDEFFATIGKLTHLSVKLYNFDTLSIPEDVSLAKTQLLSGETYVVNPISSKKIAGYKMLNDIHGNPALIMKIESPRPIYNQGIFAFNTFLSITIISIFILGLILVFLFDRFLVSKLLKLITEVNKIKTTGDLSFRIKESGNDEVGTLAVTINQMLMALDSSKKSERKTLEKVELLFQDLEKFKLAVDNVSDQIVITNKEGIVIYANKSVEKIAGFSPEEVLGKKAGSLWKTPMSHDYYESMWDTIKNKRETFKSEIQNKRKNGELYFADISISPVMNDENEIVFFVAIEHDITKEKEIEKKIIEEKEIVEKKVIESTRQLKEEKARLLTSINSLSFGFIIADMNNHVLLKNKAMIDLFGLDEHEEKSSIDHISELLEAQFDIKNKIKLCLADKNICEIKDISSNDKFLRGIIAPVITPDDNELIGYVFLLEDVTESRLIDRAKSEFVSLASHQLRTPLSAINWYTEMLLSGDVGQLKPEQQEFLEYIITSSKRMSSLVGTLLNISRIELGTFAVEPENRDLCQLIEDEIRDLRLKFSEKEIELELSFKLNPAFISVDPKLVSIVIQNFLTNAIKYTPSGGMVTISTEIDDKNGGVILSVIDNGYGIPLKDQMKIFTKMYRADNASAVDSNGNGLGLYMVKSILNSSGCKVWFESPPKGQTQGTAFYVHIPKEGMKQIKDKKRLGNQ
jgi:PAS domain S-box-containing protein